MRHSFKGITQHGVPESDPIPVLEDYFNAKSSSLFRVVVVVQCNIRVWARRGKCIWKQCCQTPGRADIPMGTYPGLEQDSLKTVITVKMKPLERAPNISFCFLFMGCGGYCTWLECEALASISSTAFFLKFLLFICHFSWTMWLIFKLCLRLGMHLSWQSASLYKPGVVAHTCIPSPREPKVGGSEVQGHSLLHSEFKDSLGYMKHCL